jgi:hypothetical protein
MAKPRQIVRRPNEVNHSVAPTLSGEFDTESDAKETPRTPLIAAGQKYRIRGLPHDTATMTAALSLREDVAKAVREKRDPVAGALARLKAAASPSGLKLDRDTDFALAAVDVGQRLLAAGDPESAEPF